MLERNPAKGIRAERVTSPLPDILFENEVQGLLTAASSDPRPYLVVLLLLETGLTKAELLALSVDNFDFSSQYQSELWVKHAGRQVFKDQRLKLPMQVSQVFADYVRRYEVSGTLFPYSQRFLSQLLKQTARKQHTQEVSAARCGTCSWCAASSTT